MNVQTRAATTRLPCALVVAPALALLLGLATAVLPAVSAAAPPLTAQEMRGREIYTGGGDPSRGLVKAYFGRDAVQMPASLLPCANCHGHDGLGRPEGGAEPSDITWSNLAKSYGHRHRMGREHPAFDEPSLAKAIAKGVDPAGNLLDLIMPRYEMSEADMAALVAYIKRLETSLDPGLSESAITIGSLQPKEGPYGALGRAVEAVLRATFDEINTAGGVYGRKLELKVADYLGAPEPTLANARRLIEKDRAFVVLGAFAVGQEREIFPVFEEGGVPLLGPVTLFAGHEELQGDSTFFLLSGLSDQARALLDHAALDLEAPPAGAAVVLAQYDIYDDVARAIARQAERHGWPAPVEVRVAGGPDAAAQRVEELIGSGVEVVFYFGPAEGLPGFAAEAAARDWKPQLLLSGLMAGRQALDLPAAFRGDLALAYPNLPGNQSPKGAEAFRALHEKHGLPREHLAAQVEAYAAAVVLVEALRRAGRALSRSGLLAALEGLSKFDTGQTPPVSYGPNRRTGVLGAHVVSIDPETKRFRPGTTWVPLD